MTKIIIDNSPYGQLKSCLGAFNLGGMYPILDDLVNEIRLKERESIAKYLEGKKTRGFMFSSDLKINQGNLEKMAVNQALTESAQEIREGKYNQ